MKKIQRLVVALFVFSSVAFAQDKLLTLDDIFSPDPARRVRFSGTPTQAQWAKDGRSFMQVINGRLMRVDAVTGNAVPYLDSGRLAAALSRAGVKLDDATAMANSPGLQFNSDESGILIDNANDLWYYDVASGNVKRLTNSRDAELEADFSPDGRTVSFVRGNNLWVVDVAKGGEKQLTRDGREGDKPIYNGYLDWVYEEELYGRGQKRGYWWSPDSRYIAFLRLDETPVPKFILANDIPNDQLIETTSYPQAGDPNPIVRLGIAEVGKSSFLPNAGRIPKIGDKIPPTLLRFGDAVKFVDTANYRPDDLLIARVAWAPDSKNVLFQALNREQTKLELNAAGLDGKYRHVLDETTPAWVEVYDNPEFVSTGSGNGTFVWQSARNGWRHLYLYDNDGRLVRQLTNGKWEIRNLYGVDAKSGWAYFSATKDSHIAENVYRVRLSGGEPERLTQDNGWHTASFDPTFTHFVDTWSDAGTPPQWRLYRADGFAVRTLNENRVDALSQYRLSRPEFLNVTTRDGFVMEAMMIKPPNFDPSRKYPVFEFTYSGPHAPSVANRWAGNRGMWFQMLAQKGYIVWVCDNRSASGKGEESVWPIYKRMYELELRDLEDGLNYLKSLPYVDGSRIGLHGWSYGGSMTSYAMTHSKSWKIGIAGGTGTDWRLYDSIYTERYMMTPDNNRDGYDRTSIVKSARNLSGKLLLIHGQMDDNVHMQNTTQFVYELQKNDKQFEVMYYPTQRHGVTNPQQAKHMYTMMTEFIMKNL
ncbi:MAG: S9 family peptidase [Chloracidobacterium sp.]|nr:S9 family peptidase [Chloracidobacterium sp.]